MRRRIAIDARLTLHPRTGFGTICHNVLRHIASVDKANDYFFYFDSDPGSIKSQYPAAGYAFGGSKEKTLWCNTFLPRQMRGDRIDVYVTFHDKEIPIIPFSAKVISMVHDLSLINYPVNEFRNIFHKAYYHTMIRVSVRRSNLILTNSDYSREEIIRTLSVPARKLRKITLGVEPGPLADETQMRTTLEKYNIRRPYVFGIGSSAPNQNNIALLKAFRAIESRFPELNLVIGGGRGGAPSFPPELLDEKVIQTGFIENDDLPLVYRAADLFVFPSLHEGFGLPVIEAMAEGVPVITSNVTALPEIAADAALLVWPESVQEIISAMTQLLSDPVLAEEMKQKGLTRARHFNWDTACREIASACMELCDARR
ncbi:glycosyltransferase family 4 protein [Occallatibacter riparius]|uniref:Glycosyltransferase family 4 protein n=1 Tax=Occallatibacter riparius TaxID=1002689 RepID=A0A9J7BSK2_9BACT|nr:glycosyltransferase family 1 protein [Occallatibacter riparius]UWZ85561.1 glycosyltransferase family 4 protein [Occallatibacter riparius]